MNIHKKFSKIFYILKPNKVRIDKLINNLQILFDKKLINIELLLNLIKGLIFIIDNDNKKIEIYTNIFELIIKSNNKTILNNFENINFSNQFKLSENKINEIIYITDIFITNYIFDDINIFNFLYEIINKLKKLNVSLLLKINIYLIYLRELNNNFFENNVNINYQLLELKSIISYINKIISN
tara:strand:- start:135 stop:683 length:549 start_codon:yes stop_codon:yes gene_type:complete